jgi:hypothetical protein
VTKMISKFPKLHVSGHLAELHYYEFHVTLIQYINALRTGDANLRFNTRLVFTHLITQYMEHFFLLVLRARCLKKRDFTLN